MSVIAYFGPAGTFTEMALDALVAGRVSDHDGAPRIVGEVTKVAAPDPASTIDLVRSGRADFACVPIESSLEGSVPATMDALVPWEKPDGHVQVFAEATLDIAFAIAAARPVPAAEIRTIAAYPVASAQVRRSVEELFPQASFQTASSNAGAAHDVAEGRADAAVTTPLAARLSDLTVLFDGVCDADDAVTRFLLVGKPAAPPARTGADRTAVILDLPNVPGSLMSAMNEFASRGIDLTRIESRPRNDRDSRHAVTGLYRFYLDAVGHIDDAAVGEALRALHRRAERLAFLGSWPSLRPTGSPPPDHSESAAWFDAVRAGGVG
ncbi:prephenate dehydratase [Gordonia soli]|uniref:Prephenate dehydratase n=1 Tax=Gordonia soli NBRC 108243 TaxID=1223545 RepID=M0QQV2_9ACTN|nr:prephenate dehydratase [Gordonia soli]GAC70948.1 prephenate dehydratase [Gordonia soli NBRC 108243]